MDIITALSNEEIIREYRKCSKNPVYFIRNYCKIERPSADSSEWIPFNLWPFQVGVLKTLFEDDKISVLKARQLGLTWVVVAYCLWMMLFKQGTVVLMVSAGDPESVALLGRLKNMHKRLPLWMQASVGEDNDHNYEFPSLGSRAQCFAPTKKAGRSQTASIVVMDEADWIMWFKELMAAMKPTIDAGGRLIQLSTPDKDRPNSPFKTLWKRGYLGQNNYTSIFLPWHVHPDRDQEWYTEQVKDAEHIDDVHQEYPATPAEALAGRSQSKRFDPEWLQNVRYILPATRHPSMPALPGLSVYEPPISGRKYLIGADCSEGDVKSDPTPAVVLDAQTWNEVATQQGVFEPTVQAGYLVQLARYYNNAVICPERNNHGHTVIQEILQILSELTGTRPLLYKNPFDKKHGWLTNKKWKPLAIDHTAEAMADSLFQVRTEATLIELANLESATLKAPEGDTDDRAMAFIIALAALRWPTLRKRYGGARSRAAHADQSRLEGAKARHGTR